MCVETKHHCLFCQRRPPPQAQAQAHAPPRIQTYLYQAPSPAIFLHRLKVMATRLSFYVLAPFNEWLRCCGLELQFMKGLYSNVQYLRSKWQEHRQDKKIIVTFYIKSVDDISLNFRFRTSHRFLCSFSCRRPSIVIHSSYSGASRVAEGPLPSQQSQRLPEHQAIE